MIRLKVGYRPADTASVKIRQRSQRLSRRDDGTSLVEIVVCISLVGVVVSALLTTMVTAVRSSTLDRDHINAHAWLQSASDVLYGHDRGDCGDELDDRASELRSEYQAFIRANSTNPEGWAAANLDVLSVRFWDGVNSYQGTCYDDSRINLQLITIQVTAPDGRIIKTVEVVKG
jgi:type II secretory pathway pseudopilin PulG